MAQYIEGTVDVTNGSAVVTGTGTLWLANAAAGDFFVVSGSAVSLIVQTVDSDTQITLDSNFSGATDTGLLYAIHNAFSAQGFPIMSEGDVFFSQIFNRYTIQLEALLAGTINVTGTFPEWITLAAGPPAAGVGNDGDLALDEAGSIYTKSGGTWSFFTNIAFDITNLTAITSMNGTDELVAQIGAGPRRITRDNALPRISDLPTLTADGVIIDNDFIWIWDATTNQAARIGVRQLVFGNFRNERYVSRATALVLSRDLDNIRPVECDGTWTAPEIIIDGNQSNIDGCFFTIINSTLGDLTLTPLNLSSGLLVDGVSAGTATMRQGRMAAISVNNGATQAVFSGG